MKTFMKFCPVVLGFLFLLFCCIILFQCQDIEDKGDTIDAYQGFIASAISSEKIDADLKILTADPHVASSIRNEELAKFILKEWESLGLDNVRLVHYDVLLSFPEDISVELVSPLSVKLVHREKGYAEDPDTQRLDVGIPYNAYSLSGDITAPLVYANSGNPQDYDLLEQKGIDVKGKIALVRYSAPYSYRGFKALTAEKRGLAGLLIYSDPKEDGSARGPVFPDGPWGPLSHIQRGGIPYDFIYPGDPLTPGWASTPGCERIPLEKAVVLPRIVSVPLSAEDALPLLENIGGLPAPEEWQGALPIPYRLGGSQAHVRMKVKMTNPIKRITNVIGSILGSDPEEGIVLVGNHRDAWIYGGHDPSSGTACLMELVRAFAEAKKSGFQPRRTITFASWDAEEFTLTGSTEWGEDNRELLEKDLVAYLNVDSAAAGQNFSVQAVPCLRPLIEQTLQQVKDPETNNTVFECWKAGSEERGTIAIASGSGVVNPIGSGTDHTVFLNHIGAPALDITFSGDYGVYHSVYDNYFWMTRFGDPGMLYTAALAEIWGRMIVALSAQPLLPLDYEAYAADLMTYLSDWSKKHDPEREKVRILNALVEEWQREASDLNSRIQRRSKPFNTSDMSIAHKVNRLLMQMERNFTIPEGIPDRDWFKHIVFGARYTYAVLLLPELTEAAEKGDDQGVTRAIANLERAVKKSIAQTKKAKELIV